MACRAPLALVNIKVTHMCTCYLNNLSSYLSTDAPASWLYKFSFDDSSNAQRQFCWRAKKKFSLAFFCLCAIKKDKRLFIEWPSTYKLSLTLSARIYLICSQSTLWQLTFQKVLKRKFSRFTFVSIWAAFEVEKINKKNLSCWLL